MPDAVPVEIAKQVTAYIDGETYSVAFTPERSYADWELELKDNDTLHVDVVVVTTEQKYNAATRGGKAMLEVPIDIAIRKRFGTDAKSESTGRIDIEEIDALMLLTEEIHTSMFQNRLSDPLSSIWKDSKLLVAPDRDALRTKSQFTSVTRVTFEGYKAT